MNPVLVAYDFSPFSRRALSLALQGYPGTGDHVIELIHVIDEHLYKNVLSKSHIPGEEDIVEYLKADVERVKGELPDGMRDLPEVVVRVERGHPHEKIVADAAKLNPDVLLIGGQGHGGFKELMVGRTAQRVIREAECPVYIIKDAKAGGLPRRVLCAVDFSEPSQDALRRALRLAEQYGAKLSLIHVTENPYIPYLQRVAVEIHDEPALKEMLEEARKKLASFETEVLGGAKADGHHVVFGQVADTIASHARILHAGTIVVGAHGHSAVRRAFLGSTTEGLIHRSATDLLVVR